ncbi:hypothetical protein ABPG75_012205 [Micractinium tetrahymenae]
MQPAPASLPVPPSSQPAPLPPATAMQPAPGGPPAAVPPLAAPAPAAGRRRSGASKHSSKPIDDTRPITTPEEVNFFFVLYEKKEVWAGSSLSFQLMARSWNERVARAAAKAATATTEGREEQHTLPGVICKTAAQLKSFWQHIKAQAVVDEARRQLQQTLAVAAAEGEAQQRQQLSLFSSQWPPSQPLQQLQHPMGSMLAAPGASGGTLGGVPLMPSGPALGWAAQQQQFLPGFVPLTAIGSTGALPLPAAGASMQQQQQQQLLPSMVPLPPIAGSSGSTRAALPPLFGILAGGHQQQQEQQQQEQQQQQQPAKRHKSNRGAANIDRWCRKCPLQGGKAHPKEGWVQQGKNCIAKRPSGNGVLNEEEVLQPD